MSPQSFNKLKKISFFYKQTLECFSEINASPNEVFFGMISYVLAEQGDVDWIFKSSYLNISSSEWAVNQTPNFTVELLPHLQEYINEVKPYTS